MTGISEYAFVAGPPGVGKSRWLARLGDVPRVSSDQIRWRLFELRGVDRDEGAGILEDGGRAVDYERWLCQFDEEILALSRELRKEGWLVELGGSLGLRLSPSEPAVCLLPTSPEELVRNLRKRDSGDRIAGIWMMRGGRQLILRWCDEFAQRTWTHGIIRSQAPRDRLPVRDESMMA